MGCSCWQVALLVNQPREEHGLIIPHTPCPSQNIESRLWWSVCPQTVVKMGDGWAKCSYPNVTGEAYMFLFPECVLWQMRCSVCVSVAQGLSMCISLCLACVHYASFVCMNVCFYICVYLLSQSWCLPCGSPDSLVKIVDDVMA